MSNDRSTAILAAPWRYAAVLNGTLALVLVGIWAWMGLQGLFWRADFSAYYTGYRMILDGQGHRLYDLDLQAEYQRKLLPEKPANEGLLPFVFGPQAAVVLSPLALLNRPVAFAVWTLLQAGMCLLAMRFLMRLQNDEHPAVRWLTMLTILAFPPLFVSFQMGQVSLWCLVCQLGFVCALKDRRPFAVGAWILAGTIKPQLMVIPCVILLGLRRWRELGWLTVLAASSALLTTLVLGPRCWLDFLAVLRFHTRQFGTYGIDPVLMYNIKGVLTSVLGADRANLINLLTSITWLASLVFVLWLWRDRGALDKSDWRGRLALSFLIGVLVTPHLYAHDVLGLVLPAVLFHVQLRQDGQQRQASAFAVLAVGAPLLFLVDCWALQPSPIGIRPFVVLMVGLTAWMAWAPIVARLRSTRAPQSRKRQIATDAACGLAQSLHA